MELSGYLAILRRWWWTLLVAAWVAGLMGYVIAGRIEPTYESSARLLVGPINSDTNTLRASSQLVQTYAELATSQGLLESTVSRDGPRRPSTRSDLAGAVRTIANDQTRILTIRVEGAEPGARRPRPRTTIAAQLIETTSRGGTAQAEGQLTVLDFARGTDGPGRAAGVAHRPDVGRGRPARRDRARAPRRVPRRPHPGSRRAGPGDRQARHRRGHRGRAGRHGDPRVRCRVTDTDL